MLCDAAVRFGPHPVILDALLLGVREREDACPENGALSALADQSPEVVEYLIDLLENGEFDPRSVASTLATLGPRAAPAVPNLLDLLTDESSDIVVAGVHALGRIGSASAVAIPRLQLLAAQDCPARHEAADALAAITGTS